MFPMKTIIITNDPSIAADAEAAGVSRLMVDLETVGKKERQASRNTFISTHTRDDVPRVRAALKKADFIVRINPWNARSPSEIDHAVGEGADIVMLPMITSMSHMEAFLAHLDGRAKPLPLVETAYSMAHISTIVAEDAIDEIYIGLNDLHLSLGLDFLFEPLGLGLLDWMAAQIKSHSKSFGFGGIATVHSGELPAERILGEHVRLGSDCVILSSRFCNDVRIKEPEGRRKRIEDALTALQAAYHQLSKRSQVQQHNDAKKTFALIRSLADKVRTRSTF
jgi:hypothetical protein